MIEPVRTLQEKLDRVIALYEDGISYDIVDEDGNVVLDRKDFQRLAAVLREADPYGLGVATPDDLVQAYKRGYAEGRGQRRRR